MQLKNFLLFLFIGKIHTGEHCLYRLFTYISSFVVHIYTHTHTYARAYIYIYIYDGRTGNKKGFCIKRMLDAIRAKQV